MCNWIKGIWKNKKILFDLAKNDFKARYTNSLLGIAWAFLLPLIMIFVLWFVFEGFYESAPVENVPFILWYIPAYLVWNHFTDAFGTATGSLSEYYYLVKNMNFQVSVLPTIKIISSAFVHVFFVGFIFAIYAVYGYMPKINNIQVLYYYICLLVYLVGLTWITSALAVFSRDVANLVALVIQVGFWVTPIVWSIDQVSEVAKSVLSLNPMFYICNGYREAFCSNVWFWEHPELTCYFWGFTLVQLGIGAYVFRRLRPQFADMM